MLGFLFGKKRVEKVDLHNVVSQMSARLWDVEICEKPNTIVVKGKYRNHQKDFKRLFIRFLGDQKIEFRDERGNVVSHIPKIAEQRDMYKHMKDIFNVL